MENSEMVIEPFEDARLDAIVRLSLRAWEPVFESLEKAMLPAVYRAFYRDDWRAAQRRAIESACSDPGYTCGSHRRSLAASDSSR
jgi:hypothetical protein